jgi:predicted NodU family carbamoyl transferase
MGIRFDHSGHQCLSCRCRHLHCAPRQTFVAAAEEERFQRIKHWATSQRRVKYCLREAGIDLGDVTHVAVNRNNRANFFRKLNMLRLICCSLEHHLAHLASAFYPYSIRRPFGTRRSYRSMAA